MNSTQQSISTSRVSFANVMPPGWPSGPASEGLVDSTSLMIFWTVAANGQNEVNVLFRRRSFIPFGSERSSLPGKVVSQAFTSAVTAAYTSKLFVGHAGGGYSWESGKGWWWLWY